MKSKFFLRLISVFGSSVLLMLQLAPLAQAQSGNMSDGTGPNINSGGNMSDATSVLIQQLLDGTLTEINGVKITAEIRQLMLALIMGEQRGIGQLVSFLVRAGVPGNLASEFARSLRGLFINGQINQAQLIIVGRIYRQIITTGGVRISVLNSFGLFQAITAMLAQFGIDVNIPVIVILPVGPAGNLSDATNPLPASLETEEETEVAEETPVEEPTEEVAEEVAEEEPIEIAEEEPVEIAESLPELESEAEISEVEETEPIVEELEPTETAELESNTEVEPVSSTTVVQQSQTVEANVSITRGRSHRNHFNNAGGVSAMNAIVTTSDIVGGRFQFATTNIFMAVIQAFQSLMAQLLGSGDVVFAGISISVEVRVSVVSLMTGSSVSSASVPTYISSLNGGGALASASVDTYVNNLINDGVPTNYAQALAATMEEMITVDKNGEVTNVDATKLTTAIAVYNETINQLSAEALGQPSETLACTGYVLSNLTEAAANAANQ